MSSGSHPRATSDPETVYAERRRIAGTVFEHARDIADAGISAITTQIPGYSARDTGFRADVHDQLARLNRTGFEAMLDKRRVTSEDFAYVRRAAARRAQSGLTLVDYINAFRLGQQATWKTMLAHAGESEAAREATLSMVAPLTRFCDLISTQAAHAYLEFQQYLSAEVGGDSRELLESLLDGVLPERGTQLVTANAHGIVADRTAPMVVVRVVVLGTATRRGESSDSDAEVRHLVCASTSRIGVNGLRTLSVVRGGEVVAVPVLGRSGSSDELCERLRVMREKLRSEGISLAIGISPSVSEVAGIPRAYQQAQAALELLPEDGGVLALPQLSPFRYLMLRADDTARHLVDPRIGAALTDDRTRGGVLADTIRAFAAADMNLREAADELRIHHNTAKYRLGRIQELTGRNVRSINDLVELLVAIELQTSQQE
ncbi:MULTISPECIES: PucR family transcriptional regulator [Nocardia]|uniref:Helix-turn-helix domain-containing protein n=1 Tax=Nocardia aurea TaxID=2144174 RepID=A0ABV3FZF1_9NOCA|nr:MULTISPECIES: helix-turn-helix domain-containing protein [Nocardia]